jgi:predicted amidophosphoribosyltransferase
MPTFKHPCPFCGKFIDKIVATCLYCGQVEPFSPRRCQTCRKIVEDPAWVVCPSCGASLVTPSPGAGAATATATSAAASTGGAAVQAAPPQPPPAAPTPAPAQAQPAAPPRPPAGTCSGCGAPLPSGARFCTICGTMAG